MWLGACDPAKQACVGSALTAGSDVQPPWHINHTGVIILAMRVGWGCGWWLASRPSRLE
jgi:hypothetical protein